MSGCSISAHKLNFIFIEYFQQVEFLFINLRDSYRLYYLSTIQFLPSKSIQNWNQIHENNALLLVFIFKVLNLQACHHLERVQ